MQFAPLCPLSQLHKWGKVSKTHLVLAQHLKNEEYLKFYQERRAEGDIVILDNGAYEAHAPLNAEAYYYTILSLVPNIAILPDYLMQPARKTVSKVLRFLDQYWERIPAEIQWMVCPQIDVNENIGDWFNGLSLTLGDLRVGHLISWVGLGRYLATHFNNQRVLAAMMVKANFPHLKIHALGMAKGSVEEMKRLADVGVDSIDSSAPIWRGLCGFGLGEYWPEIQFDLLYDPRNDTEDHLVVNNLKQVGIEL